MEIRLALQEDMEGMQTIGTFDFGDNHYFLMGIHTDAADKYFI